MEEEKKRMKGKLDELSSWALDSLKNFSSGADEPFQGTRRKAKAARKQNQKPSMVQQLLAYKEIMKA